MYTDSQELFPGVIIYRNALPFQGILIEKYERIFSESNKYKWQQARVGYNKEEISNRKCVDFKYKLENVSGDDHHSLELQETHKEITKSLQECLKDYSKKYHVDVSYQEAINVVRYGAGEYFKPHSDDGEPYRCTVSAVGYPNDDYEGGELYFVFFDTIYKAKAGDLVIFPSSYVYAHEAMPVHSGIKYSLVIMNDRNELAHKSDSPIYHDMENK
jgi:hypothetical protein